MDEQINALATLIKDIENIVFLTGAGISTASGIPDFRSDNGIWKQEQNREYYLSTYYYQKKPKDFWKKYKEIFNLKLMDGYQPNFGHSFIRELEENGKTVTVLTQNVDGLHQMAGSQHVIELHGTIKTATCPKCKQKYDLDFILEQEIPRCTTTKQDKTCGFILKPDMVMFGDTVMGYKEAEKAIDTCKLFIVLGSSLEVSPVNELPQYAKYDWQTKLVLVNRDPTIKDRLFDIVIHTDINQTLSDVKSLIIGD
ncbi:NAD-dependent protein deacylase (plasmid) [Aneurinibacillus sp. Ricciae_BoGa-3]|uniref:NAD-dependent protein deacylase n=1 Tax=Aneurinibacillus sp. Ricciae_BoGa-3 TaxID=3022697 RepID=UPI0023413CC6|nr:NAD-dependent protein deacylase [Aneurinibacillus sp. Ricciae_BoGa-3]WCK57122.1 NAD-dependent protein deacylase [Aneurinibacillus sp. Ricciae_BoGa-3]